mgnify:CR=1 FL=1
MGDAHVRWTLERPGGHRLIGDDSGGDGETILLLHGLTATRRYVLHGSRLLERQGYRLISYDARGHGESDPAPQHTAYDYRSLTDDALAVLDARGVDRAVLAGHSMGSHTAVALALAHPDRVAALVLGAPAHLGRPTEEPERWDRLADGLRTGGVEGFYDAIVDKGPPEWHERLRRVVLQRMERHLHRDAVADALTWTPRSTAFDGMAALDGVRAPTLIVATRDTFDADHPYAVAMRYRDHIAGSVTVTEPEGSPPLTWRGGALSAEIAGFLASRG